MNVVLRQRAIIAISAVAALLFAAAFFVRVTAKDGPFATYSLISSSPDGGSYRQALKRLFAVVNEHEDQLGFGIDMEDRPAAGEWQTIRELRSGEVAVGLIQGDMVVLNVEQVEPVAAQGQQPEVQDQQPAAGNQQPEAQASRRRHDIYAVAKLYDEVFMLFTRQPETDLAALCARMRRQGRPLRTGSLGPESQVHIDLGRLLEYYGCDLSRTTMNEMSYAPAQQALRDGDIEIAFMIAGYRQPVIRELAATRGVHLLNLTDRPGLLRNYGGWREHTIIPGLFGAGTPRAPIQTVSTPSILVINDTVPRPVAYDLAAFIFSHEDQIEMSFPQFDIDIPTTQTGVQVHPASLRAHQGEPLPWLIRNAPLIGVALPIAGLIISLFAFLLQVLKWRHERKQVRDKDDPDDDAKPGKDAPASNVTALTN